MARLSNQQQFNIIDKKDIYYDCDENEKNPMRLHPVHLRCNAQCTGQTSYDGRCLCQIESLQ
jgi:hypothetical protein